MVGTAELRSLALNLLQAFLFRSHSLTQPPSTPHHASSNPLCFAPEREPRFSPPAQQDALHLLRLVGVATAFHAAAAQSGVFSADGVTRGQETVHRSCPTGAREVAEDGKWANHVLASTRKSMQNSRNIYLSHINSRLEKEKK